jgi:hypothetical protein
MRDEELGVSRDTNINVDEIYANATAENGEVRSQSAEKEDKAAMTLQSLISSQRKPFESVPAKEFLEEKKEEELSPLEAAIKSKKSASGFVGEEDDPDEDRLRPLSDSDRRRDDMEHKLAEIDDLTKKSKAVIAIKKPQTKPEYVELMDDISQVQVDPETGEATFVPNSKYIIAKTPEVLAEIEKLEKNKAEGIEPEEGQQEYLDATEVMNDARKQNLVHILIDKTGLGPQITFDDEEKKAIQSTNMIHLVEVEDKDLRMVEFDRQDQTISFLQAIDKYQLSVSKAPMSFPASGFKADMTGLTFGEFADIALDPGDESTDYISFDKMNRRLYTIYNHMVNISIGGFKDYEDFLKKFAYVDVPLAIYGLTIVTQPEEDELVLTCNVESCKSRIPYKYQPRSIIDFDSADIKYLDAIREVNECAPEDRMKVALESPVRKVRRIQMPYCKYLVDFRTISCYEYLYGVLDYVNKIQEEVDKYEDDDPALYELNKKVALIPILNSIGMILIPKSDGSYYAIKKVSDIMEALLSMKPADIDILWAAFREYQAKFYIGFSLKNIECPKCHHKTKSIPITPDELVFLITQRLGSTEISFDNFRY